VLIRITHIRLRDGERVLVDGDLAEHLNQWQWRLHNKSNAAYRWVYTSATRTVYPLLMHRYIMGLEKGDPLEVDHKNGNGLDNRRRNLRICTHAQNTQNVPAHRDGASSYRGVEFHSEPGRRKPWQGRLMIAGKRYSAGYHKTEEEAAKAVAKLRLRLMTHANEARHPA
jgi:hypothetical protein